MYVYKVKHMGQYMYYCVRYRVKVNEVTLSTFVYFTCNTLYVTDKFNTVVLPRYIVRKPAPAHRTSRSTQHIRPSGVFDRWSDGLELAA